MQYAKLNCLREEYPAVPIMALTASANETVEKNVVDKLGIAGCVRLSQSFNRKNLFYDVREKNKARLLSDIATWVKTQHRNQTGIIYCLSRDNCEEVAHGLREQYDLTAEHYHAQITQEEKKQVTERWQNEITQIIVATVSYLSLGILCYMALQLYPGRVWHGY